MRLLSKIKGFMPESLKRSIKLLFVSSKDSKWIVNSSKQTIYIFLAGFYQNLGDLAITYAQRQFLRCLFPDAEIVTVPSTSTYGAIKTIKRVIRHSDIVTITGGGNMDDMYVSLEEARLHVVKNFPDNRIISFPQTFVFSDSPFGRKRQEISHKIYSRHKNVTIFVRELYSLERINKAFPDVKTGYCPDIVLSLKKDEPRYQRHGVLCCLRSDKEKHIHSGQRELLVQSIKKEFHDVTIYDTVDVSLEECMEDRYEQTLESFWDLLRHKEVVITDRLHCMIFCAITGTPCVVMDNSNHKISGVYSAWLKDADYIRFTENSDSETVIGLAKELSKICIDEAIDLTSQFEPLRRVLQN